jgi:phenylalanyl-tRNA synthetase beta chain
MVHLLRDTYFSADERPIVATSGFHLGCAGQLARRVADQLKFRQDVYVAELRLEPLLAGIEAARAATRFKPLPRFPAVERDFSLVLADGVTFARVEETIRALGIPELQSIKAADLFRGGQIPAGKYSLMIRVTFQSAQETFTDVQLADFSARIVAALEQKLAAALRAS